jgi:hypothetical protein
MRKEERISLTCQYCKGDFEARPSDVARGKHVKYCTRRCADQARVGTRDFTEWEVDWNHEGNTGTEVWARNKKSKREDAREWHWVTTGYLRSVGVKTPEYRKDSWEIDWSKRDEKKVWARNPESKMPEAREWHWIEHKTLDQAGVAWKPLGITGRYIDANGYVNLTKRGMTNDEITLADKYELWRGKKKLIVREHQLIAVKKYGFLPEVVRHINGIKDDNRPDNLIGGTSAENTMDHNTARIMAMYWREQYEKAKAELDHLR